MAFKIKDLMITVLAGKTAAARQCEFTCGLVSCDFGGSECDDDSIVICDFCSDFGSDCGDCSDGTDCTECTLITCGCTCTACSQCTQCSCSLCTGGCTQCSACTCSKCTAHTCTFHTICTVCSHLQTCGPTAAARQTSRLRASDLPKLKAQLQRALKQVEAKEEAVAKKMQPRTVEQIELLEAKLREALEELARQKKELPAKEEKGGASEKKNQKGDKK